MGLVITGGEHRGRKLLTDSDSLHVRPTSGKVREALFSALGGRAEGAAFVDLFAGSGAVGLEAYSRGASEVFLVENHPKSWPLLKANCESVARGDAAVRPVRASVAAFCKRMAEEGKRFDIVFADPPFGDDFSPLPLWIDALMAPGGAAVVQYPSRKAPPWVQSAAKNKIYGESGLAFFEAPISPAGGRSIF